MTITQVKEINEKIIELTDHIRRYRFETRCVNLEPYSSNKKDIGLLDLVIARLDFALQTVISCYFYEIKHATCYADMDYLCRKRDEWLDEAADNRVDVNDDISLDELSLWIDLFALIF